MKNQYSLKNKSIGLKNIISNLQISIYKKAVSIILLLFVSTAIYATNYYSYTNAAPEATASWWTGTNGTGTHPANFTTVGDVFTIQNSNTMASVATSGTWTVAGTVIVSNACALTINTKISVSIGTFTVNSGATVTMNRNLTVTGNTSISGAISFASTSGTARAMKFTGDLTLNSGAVWTQISSGNGAANTYNFGGNFTNNATTFNDAGTGVHTFSGTAKTISGSTITSIPSIAITGTYTNNGTLTVNTALSGAGGLTQGSNAVLNIGGTTTTGISITTLTATASGNSVNYTGAAQTIKATTYNNLTLSGSGAKTFPTGTTTVNATLSIENGTNANTFTGSIVYGATAILQYNAGSSARTVSTEWPTTFTANTCAGGVLIKGTGAISLNGAKTLNSGVPLNINSGATLTPGTNLLTLGGDFTNAGTLTSGAGGLTFNGTTTIQTVGAFTTTGPVTIGGTSTQNFAAFTSGAVSMTKTGGTATFTGNVSGTSLTINGSGGTLNLGSSLTHTFSGDITLTAGSLNGGSSTLNVNSSTTTAWGGTGSLFTANIGMVVFGGGTQTLSATATRFYNLTFSGTSVNKTITNPITVDNDLNINSSAVVLFASGNITSTTKDLYFNSIAQLGGTWGGTLSAATNKNSTYFGSSTTGIINISNIQYFKITGTATQTAGTSQNLTITAYNAGGTVLTNYTGDKVLTFSGANSSVSPVNAPTIKDKNGTAVAFGSSTTITFTNGIATVSGANNGVLNLYKAENAIISVTDGNLTTSGSDCLIITVVPATISMSFSSQPNGGLIAATWSSQPVINFKDAYGNSELASNPHTVALTISTNPSLGSLSGTTSVAMNTSTSQATFSGLSIDKAGSGYILQAATSGLSSVTSNSFDISNPSPTLSTISPSLLCAGGGAFTLTVNGTNFNSNSVVKLNGSSRTTTFVNSTQLSAAILANDVASAGTPSITVYTATPGGGTSTSAAITVSQVVIGTSIVQPSCYADGSITITASGGTAPYTYDWFDISGTNNVQNRVGLKAGTYQVTVTDANGCSATSSVFTLTAASNCIGISVCKSDVASILSVTPDPKNTSYTWTVPTGATITSGQGTPSITVNWTAVVIGAYQVSVIASNGCGTSTTSFIDVYVEKPTISAYADPVCSGSALNLYAFGGTTYSWTGPSGFASQSATPVVLSPVAGRYYVRVTNEKGCSDTTSVVVAINTAPTVSGVVTTNNITLTVSGGTGFTYSWRGLNSGFTSTSQNLSNLSSDNYTVVVTNSTGCSTTKTFSVVDFTVGISSTNVTTCIGGSNASITLSPSGGASPYTTEWTGPSGFTSTSQDLSGLFAGTYTAIVTDNNGLLGYASATITEPTAIQADGVVTNINCYGSSTGSIVQTVSGGTPTYSYAWTGPNSFTATTKDISNRPAGTYSVTITDHAGSGTCTLSKSYTITQPSAAISATPTITNAKCYGDSNGQITLSVSGGTSPYTYAWTGPSSYSATTPNIQGLSAGTYAVTITDSKGCSTLLSSLSVTQPSVALSTTGSTQNNITIYGNNNGSITLSVSGGTSPYTYTWSNGAVTQNISSLIAGTYSVLVTDANACTTTASFTITSPTQLSASATPTAASCYNSTTGSVSLSVSGGTSPYTYLWSNSATTQNLSNVASGYYSVTVTDHNGATVGASATVNNPSAIIINGSVTNVLCNGTSTGAITISVSGGTGSYNYDWADISGTNNSQNRTSLAAGSYTVTVSDANGCSSSKTFTVTQTSALSLSSTHSNILCRGDNTGSISLSVSGGQSPYTFLWSNNATTQNIDGLTAGNYSVQVTDANGCTANTSTITITQPSNSLSSSISHSNVSCKNGNNGSITLTASGGTSPYTYIWSNGSNTQSLTDLTDGTYTVTITDANGCTTTNAATITEPSTLITLYATSKNASSCGGATGSINLTVENGTAPFTYAWTGPNSYSNSSKNISSLNTGSYSVIVTDNNGCSSSLSVSVGSASSLSVSVTTYDKSCPNNDGAAYAVVTGGVEPYTYLWTGGLTTNNITGLGTGTYSVTVTDANGCTASANGTVSSPSCAPPVAAIYNFTTGSTTPLVKSVATSKITDADNTLSQLSFLGLTIPTPDQGTLDWDPSNGGFVFTPNPTFNGTVSVNYQVVDPTNLTSTSQLNITVKQEVQTYNLVATPSFTAAKLKWKNGSRASRVVFMSEAGAAISDPVYGTSYTASANWNIKGTQLSNSGYYCIYNGTDTTVYLTHLYPGTQYTVQAYEYDGAAGSEDYLTNLTGANNPNTFIPWPTTTFTNTQGIASMETWNTAARWDHDTIPTANLHPAVLVYIDGNCVVTNAAESNNLTIKTVHNGITPKLTISAANSLNVIGPFANNGAASALLVKSSATAPNGTLTWGTGIVNGTVEMYSKASWDLTKEVNNRYSWQFFGIPVKQLTAGNAFNFNSCYVRKWDESVIDYYDVWIRQNNGTTLYQNSGSILTAGLGYELVQQNPTTYSFSGELFHADYSKSLPYSSGAIFAGQHVLANPYTAAIDISSIDFGPNTEQAIYQYTTGTYQEWLNGTGQNTPGKSRGQHMASSKNTAGKNSVPAQIPSMQGFLVKAIGGTGSITIPYVTALKTDTAIRRSKSAVQVSNTSNVSTRIDITSDTFNDRMWIFSDDACTRKFDNGWDGRKIVGTSLTTQFFAVEEDGNYQIDAVNDMNETILAFQPGIDSNYKLTFTHQNINQKYNAVFLLDLVDNKVIDISQTGTEYAFSAKPKSALSNRFKISADLKKQTDSGIAQKQIRIFSTPEVVFVQNSSSLPGEFLLYNMSGVTVSSVSFNPYEIKAISTISLAQGAYIVKAKTDIEKITERIIIR